MKTLYCTYVPPHLEFAIQAWCSYLIKDIIELENIQKKATQLIPELSHMHSEERLKASGLTTLEERRLRGDLIQQFKITKGYDSVRLGNSMLINQSSSIEGPAFNIQHKQRIIQETLPRFMAREHFYSKSVALEWNRLPKNVINSKQINNFKANVEQIDIGMYCMKKIKSYF